MYIYSFIHSVLCLMTGPQHLPKQVLHRLRSSASSFNLHYPLVSLRSSSSCLRFLPGLPVTSILLSLLYICIHIHTHKHTHTHITDVRADAVTRCVISKHMMPATFRIFGIRYKETTCEISGSLRCVVRLSLFCGVTRRGLVACYRRFGTIYRSHLQGSSRPRI